MGRRSKYSAKFKAKVAIEAIKERETLTALSKRFEVSPVKITSWKNDFLKHSDKAFESETPSVKKMDKQYTAHPTSGVKTMRSILKQDDLTVNPKRIRRLMHLMNLRAIYPLKSLSKPGNAPLIKPYLLRISLDVDPLISVMLTPC